MTTTTKRKPNSTAAAKASAALKRAVANQRQAVDTTDLKQLVDDFGQVKAEISDLTERAAELRDALIATGLDAAEGDLFRATVSRSETTSVNWKAIAMKLKPSRQLIAAHTTSSDRTTVRVVSR